MSCGLGVFSAPAPRRRRSCDGHSAPAAATTENCPTPPRRWTRCRRGQGGTGRTCPTRIYAGPVGCAAYYAHLCTRRRTVGGLPDGEASGQQLPGREGGIMRFHREQDILIEPVSDMPAVRAGDVIETLAPRRLPAHSPLAALTIGRGHNSVWVTTQDGTVFPALQIGGGCRPSPGRPAPPRPPTRPPHPRRRRSRRRSPAPARSCPGGRSAGGTGPGCCRGARRVVPAPGYPDRRVGGSPVRGRRRRLRHR